MRYLIDLINAGASDGEIQGLPAFSGDIEDYYETVWASIANDENAVQALGLMSRLRWGIPLPEFLSFVDSNKRLAFGAALPRIRHLLAQSDLAAAYHDSFAQFLSSKTAIWETDFHDQLADYFRAGVDSPYATLNRVYHGLRGGNLSRQRTLLDCSQDWVDRCVFIGVAPDALLEDVDDTINVATESGNAVATVRLLLLSQRVRHRYNTLFAGAASLAAKALVALGHSRDALRFTIRQGRLLIPFEEAMAVALQLADAGNHDEAYELLEEIDVRVLESLSERLESEEVIGLVSARTQVLVLMLAMHREPTQQSFPAFIESVKDTIRGDVDEPSRLQAAMLTQIDSNFVASMLCFIDQSSAWLQSLPKKLTEGLLGTIDRLASILISLREQTNGYGLRAEGAALRTVVQRFEEEARKEIALGSKTRAAVAESLVLWGGSADVVKALCEEQVATKTLTLTFVKKNHALVDEAEFLEAYSVQRLRGYIGATTIALPDVAWDKASWLATLERLASDLARWDGAVRAAKASNTSRLDELWPEGERKIFALLDFTLAERVKWDESYAVPELIVPHLYRMLASVCIACYPQRLPNLLEVIDAAFDGQCGLYTEGFRSLLSKVLELVSREATRLGLVSTVMLLMTRWRDYVLKNVQNRIELVPELLEMVPPFVNLGATEEASRTYQAALANSMGPNWYKEDQFSMTVDTLATFPAHDSVSATALPRIQSYLDAASGELTFQRFVRYAKQSLLGELCRRDRHHQAVRLFSKQMCGTQDELYAQATSGGVDRVSLLVGMRYPGRELDEQAGIIELVNGCMTADSWRMSWALLEIFHEGDDRHLSRWGEAYARLANLRASRQDDLNEMSRRWSDLSLRRYKEGDKETLFKAFAGKLEPALRTHFPGLVELPSPTATAIDLEPSSEEAAVHETKAMPDAAAAAAADADADGDAEATKPTPADRDLDRLYMPGTFGKGAALQEADAILKLSEGALRLGNRASARTDAIRALQTIQQGGWSIWRDSSNYIRRAEAVLDESAPTVPEITQLYGPLLHGERHNFRWITANRFIERVGGRLGEPERGTLCEVVLDHIRLLLGDAAPSPEIATHPAAAEGGPETALFSLLVWALDHPRPKTRHETARMMPWLLREDGGFLKYTLPRALSIEPSNAADVICGALDVLSRESPKSLWERIEAQLPAGATMASGRHLGRRAALRRIVRRAAEAGSATASAALKAFDDSWNSERQSLDNDALSVIVRAPASWGFAAKSEWSQLTTLGLATSALAGTVDSLLTEICTPLAPAIVLELEDLLSQGFSSNTTARFGRWEARVRTALHRALFETAPREMLERLDDALRICNPSLLPSPIGDRFPLARFVTGQQDRWRRFKPQVGNQVFLCYQGMVISDERSVLVEIVAFLRPGGGGFAGFPKLQPSFRSTELPKPGPSDLSTVCAFVDPAMAYFGTLTPAILQPRFAQQLGASPGDIHRSVWHDWTDSDGASDVYARESAALSISRSALHLPDGFRLAWLVRFDGKAVATID